MNQTNFILNVTLYSKRFSIIDQNHAYIFASRLMLTEINYTPN